MTHTLKRLSVKAVVALGLGLGAWMSGVAQSVTWLGVQPNHEGSVATAVSSNGAVVVGYSESIYYNECCYTDEWGNCMGCTRTYRDPFRWTASGGLQNLGRIHNATQAMGVSADGSVVVGAAWQSSYNSCCHYDPNYGCSGCYVYYNAAFRWTQSSGSQNLGSLGGGRSGAYGISADGSVIVGWSTTVPNGLSRAVRWTDQGIQELGRLPNAANYSIAYAASADGSVVVGWAENASRWQRAFRWTEQGGMQDLGTLGGNSSEARGVSADGSVVVGVAANASGRYRAFRWTEQGEMQDLGTLGGDYSEARGVSADGSVVVGVAANASGRYRAFRWTAQRGMEDLNQTYANLLTNGSYLTAAHAISPDGRYIVGYGYNAATGREEAFLLDTGPRCTAHNGDVDGSGCVDDADLLAVLFAFGNQGQDGVDVNCDGTVDDADLLLVLFNFGSGC